MVEDEPFNAQYIDEILRNTGLKLFHTVFGKEAVKMAVSHAPDIILMDIRLPDLDGYKATRQILRERPGTKVIAQTAYAAQDDRQKALDAGCVDYISKPIHPESLLAMIKKHL